MGGRGEEEDCFGCERMGGGGHGRQREALVVWARRNEDAVAVAAAVSVRRAECLGG